MSTQLRDASGRGLGTCMQKYVNSPTKSKALHIHLHAICALKHFLEPEDEKVN